MVVVGPKPKNFSTRGSDFFCPFWRMVQERRAEICFLGICFLGLWHKNTKKGKKMTTVKMNPPCGYVQLRVGRNLSIEV